MREVHIYDLLFPDGSALGHQWLVWGDGGVLRHRRLNEPFLTKQRNTLWRMFMSPFMGVEGFFGMNICGYL